MERLTVPVLKYELQKRQMDCRGVKAVLVQRLTQALNEEGCDPDSYVSDFDGTSPGAASQTVVSGSDPDAADPVGPGLATQAVVSGSVRDTADGLAIGEATQPIVLSSDRDHAGEIGVDPHDSASQVQSHTSRRSIASVHSDALLRKAEAAKTAALLAKLSMLKEKREAEELELQETMKIKKMEADARRVQEEIEMKKREMELRIRQRKEDLALRTEIKEAEARAQAITEEERIVDQRDCESRSSDHHGQETESGNSVHRQILFDMGEVQERREASSYPQFAGHGIDTVGTGSLALSQARFNQPQHTEHQSDVGDGVSRSDHLPIRSRSPERLSFEQNRANEPTKHDVGPSKEAHHWTQRPATDSLPPPPKKDSGMEGDDVMKALLMQQARNGLPKLEISKFGGNITDFVPFIEAFDSVIGSRLETDKEKLLYLEQYTTGEPKEIVKGCLMLPASEGYARARTRLQRRYGDERRMASTMVDKLLSWPSIRSDDIKGLDEYSIFLTGCSSSMPTGISSVRELDHPGLLRSVAGKLPTHLQERWRRTAVAIQDSGRGVIFHDLASFVENEVRIASDPLFGTHVTEQREAKGYAHAKSDKSRKTSCLATSVAETSKKYKCWYCSEDHLLDDCTALQKETPDGKRQFLMKHALCFGCLRRGHRAAECKSRKFCKVCNGRHPTLLHEERPISGRQTDSHQSSVETMVKNGAVDIIAGASKAQNGMSIIPVKVRVNGGRAVSTYAFLDNGSSASFCTESLLRELGVREAEPTQLSLSTVDPNITRMDSRIVTGMQVSDMAQTEFVSLPPVYSLQKIPVTPEDIPRQRDLHAWPHLQDIDIPEADAEIGLMIGNDVPEIMEPWDIVHGRKPGEPFAVRTKVGWVVNGPVRTAKRSTIQVNRVGIGEVDVHQMFISMYNEDVQDATSLDEKGLSREDHAWMEHVSSSCTRTKSGHYEIALPFKEDNPALPCNRQIATQRLVGLKRKLTRDGELHRKYTAFMTEMIQKGYAEPVPEESMSRADGKVWYIPHHGVHQEQKPDKLRVVFDCAAKFQGISLNAVLLQGPDLTNNLADVLIRMREAPVAFMADIESMFYQVGVPPEDRDVLRFLWWPEGDMTGPPKEYRMTVHLFGATSSPSCANYALRKTAEEFGSHFDEQAEQVVKRNFYVDDCLRSDETEDEAIRLVKDLRSLCRLGGFNLTKFASTSRPLLRSLPYQEREKDVKSIDLNLDDLPQARALGVCWRMEDDVLGFSMSPTRKPVTKRGILSTVSSVYDPLGIAAPFVLGGRLILQNLCRLDLGWDDDIPDDQQRLWVNWLDEFPSLSQLQMNRCYKPERFGKVTSCQLHHFSDASEVGYGVVSYLRMVNEEGQVHCCFVFGKARVAPLKAVTIPRLELMGAVTAVHVNHKLQKALNLTVTDTVYWTDSTTVLSYIGNRTTRFHRFVSNRLEIIHDGSSTSQWRYVDSAQNPADDSSRGRQTGRWLQGPAFLWKGDKEWPKRPEVRVAASDPEVKQAACKAFFISAGTGAGRTEGSSKSVVHKLAEHFSNWYRLKKAVAWLMRLRSLLLQRVRLGRPSETVSRTLTVEELNDAEDVIIAAVQRQAFTEDIAALESGSAQVKKSSSLSKLDPALYDGLLRVGGRMDRSDASFSVRHPIILPRKGHTTRLIIEDAHRRVGHQGREHVLAELRERYWIVKGPSAVRKVLRDCLRCRRHHATPMTQKMAHLPEERTKSGEPPFTNTGVDFFGPFYTKRGRAQVKVYGVIFTCLASRAVHLELADSLSTDSFINALRRFVARRGQVRIIRSDRGTNFVGAERELKENIDQWNDKQVQEALLQKNIQWVFNPPHASHFGGVWERQIRTVRKVLDSLLRQQTLTDDSLRTLLCEVEAIINSRPLTCVSSDPGDLQPITPAHFLHQREGIPLPPGLFDESDSASRKRWRQVQYLSDLFWKRWRKEYLPLLQKRSRWLRPSPNLQVGDLVILVDENTPRGHWRLGKVSEAIASPDGLVRRAKVRTNQTTVERPVTKLVLLSEEA